MALLTILDETATGSVISRLEVEISQEMLTFHGLVQPTESERLLNGYRLRLARLIDAEQQTYRALEAFQNNGFFLLVNDRQVESLDEEIWLGQGATASFVKLTPLVGG